MEVYCKEECQIQQSVEIIYEEKQDNVSLTNEQTISQTTETIHPNSEWKKKRLTFFEKIAICGVKKIGISIATAAGKLIKDDPIAERISNYDVFSLQTLEDLERAAIDVLSNYSTDQKIRVEKQKKIHPYMIAYNDHGVSGVLMELKDRK